MTEKDHNWAVLDPHERFVLYSGTRDDCQYVIDHSHTRLLLLPTEAAIQYIKNTT